MDDQHNTTMDSSSTISMCDESKCLSTGMSHAYNASHTCYGDDDATNPNSYSYHPMMCADGYLPRVVVGDTTDTDIEVDRYAHARTVPTTSADGTGTMTTHVTVRYFTCCPPPEIRCSNRSNNNNNDSLIDDIGIKQERRHCSDPIWVDETTKTTETISEPVEVKNVCREEDPQSRKYPRRMKSYRTGLEMDVTVSTASATMGAPPRSSEENYFICCDFDSFDPQEQESLDNGNGNGNNTTATVMNCLEDTECVPYHNQWYEVAQSQNRMGRLSARSCDVENFTVPRPIPIDNDNDNPNSNANATITTTSIATAATFQRYQCCKTGSAMQPFVNDSMFRINVYVPLALYIVAAMLLTTIVTSLLVPFLIELKKKLTNGNNNSNGRSRRRTASNAQTYSTYNLYIIYLLLPDLAYTLCLIAFSIKTIQQHFDPTFYTMMVWPAGTVKKSYEETYLLWPWVIGNCWINGIISYKVVSLLKASKSVQRIVQPSTYRVTLEACAVYGVMGLSALGFHYLFKINISACWVVWIGLIMPPCLYILYAPITVWRNKYLPPLETILWRSSSTEQLRDRAIRELALYFFRIIAAYCVTVAPGIFLWRYGYYQVYQASIGGSGSDWGVFGLTVCLMLQMIVSSGFVLNKSDVRKYVWDLVTLSYVFKNAVPKNATTKNSKLKTKQHKPPSLRFDEKNRKDDPCILELYPPVSRSTQTTSRTSRIDDSVPSGAEVSSGIDENDDDDDDAGALNAEAGIGAYNDDAACELNATEGSDDENDDSECLISSLFGVHRPSERSLGAEAEGKPQENCYGEVATIRRRGTHTTTTRRNSDSDFVEFR